MGWEKAIFNWLGAGRYNPAPPTLTPGSLGEFQLDANGSLKVRFADPLVQWVDPTQLASSAVIKDAAGSLYQLFGSNEGYNKIWVQIFDASSVPNGGEGSPSPISTIPVEAQATFSLELPRGRSFATGIVWAASQSPASLSRDMYAQIWANAEFV
jgi:hypothetical protein